MEILNKIRYQTCLELSFHHSVHYSSTAVQQFHYSSTLLHINRIPPILFLMKTVIFQRQATISVQFWSHVVQFIFVRLFPKQIVFSTSSSLVPNKIHVTPSHWCDDFKYNSQDWHCSYLLQISSRFWILFSFSHRHCRLRNPIQTALIAAARSPWKYGTVVKLNRFRTHIYNVERRLIPVYRPLLQLPAHKPNTDGGRLRTKRAKYPRWSCGGVRVWLRRAPLCI